MLKVVGRRLVGPGGVVDGGGTFMYNWWSLSDATFTGLSIGMESSHVVSLHGV